MGIDGIDIIAAFVAELRNAPPQAPSSRRVVLADDLGSLELLTRDDPGVERPTLRFHLRGEIIDHPVGESTMGNLQLLIMMLNASAFSTLEPTSKGQNEAIWVEALAVLLGGLDDQRGVAPGMDSHARLLEALDAAAATVAARRATDLGRPN